MTNDLNGRIRDAGYEALFIVGGFLALSVQPTLRNLDAILRWIDESKSRQEFLRRLEKRGLVESGLRRGRWVPVLTELGRAVFAGGRHPERPWNRPWDGTWRLLTFDLPRKDNVSRMKLRRWMCQNHFGRLQGSVWISPDPVPAIAEVLAGNQIESTKMMIFEGAPAGPLGPREVAASAWDFDAIDAGYNHYTKSAERILHHLEKSTPSQTRLRGMLQEDRQHWWEAVRRDPLLPKTLHPKGYEGPSAWKIHGKLLKKLGKKLGPSAK